MRGRNKFVIWWHTDGSWRQLGCDFRSGRHKFIYLPKLEVGFLLTTTESDD